MRKLSVLLAVAIAASAPGIAFAKKAKAPAPQTFESLNKDGLKVLHDVFIWPAEAPAKKKKK
jgi:hypothetical protein